MSVSFSGNIQAGRAVSGLANIRVMSMSYLETSPNQDLGDSTMCCLRIVQHLNASFQ